MRHDPHHVATESSVGPRFRGELAGASWATLGVISVGGVIGALARYGLLTAFPHAPGGFAWGTFGINVSGALLIGVVIVVATETRRVHHLVRPFLATGVLGGFTTFSTFMMDAQRELAAGAPRTALLYAAGTTVAALAAAWTGITLTRLATGMPLPDEARIANLDEAGAEAGIGSATGNGGRLAVLPGEDVAVLPGEEPA
jgi:CrcB protein